MQGGRAESVGGSGGVPGRRAGVSGAPRGVVRVRAVLMPVELSSK